MFKFIDKTIKYSHQVKMEFFKMGNTYEIIFYFGLTWTLSK